jgi:hypothetical protein
LRLDVVIGNSFRESPFKTVIQSEGDVPLDVEKREAGVTD